MSEMKTAHGILDVIKSITANRESGRLDISSFGTHGTLLFNEGKLIDARLESLSGFQAVNAAVSLRNVEFSFDHVAPVAHATTITAAERVVLQRFFGIETADMEEPTDQVEPHWNTTPEQVVPLIEVEEIPVTAQIPLREVDEIRQVDLADTPTVEAEPPVLVGSPVASTLAAPKGFSRNAAPFGFGLRPAVAVAVCVVLLVGLAVAATALRSKWKARQQAAAVASAVETEPSAVPAVQPAAKTDESSSVTVSEAQTPAQQSASTQQKTSAAQQNTSTQSKTAVSSVAPETTPARNVSPAPPAISAERRTTETDANVQDLTGEWRVINTVDKTAYKSFDSMQVGFRLKINQQGKQFTARGEKFSENGQTLPAGSRTPIRVSGSVEGNRVVATFVEEGRARKTNGRFVWRLQHGGDALAGTFVTTAANSSGRSAVTKQ